jgi:sugar phosphate isomerase/epimerase
MEFGTSVHALTDWSAEVKPFRQVLGEAAELGFTQIMLMNLPGQAALTADNEPQGAMIDLEQSDLSLVREAVAEAGLTVCCAYQALMRVANEDEAAETVTGLMKLADLALGLQTDVLLPNAGLAPAPKTPTMEKRELLDRLSRVVTEALETIPSHLKIAPDIHYGGVLETVADCLYYFDQVKDPRGGITLNIGHMTTLGEEGWRLLELHPERVHVVAWKDHLVPPPPEATHAVYSVELGTGQSPFERYAKLLPGDGGPHKHLITFEHVPLAQKKAALGRGLQYMRKLWAETH